MNEKEVKLFLSETGEPEYRWKQIQSAVYGEGCLNFGQISNLPADLREKLDNKFSILPFKVVSVLSGDEGSYKAILELIDKEIIETVLVSSKKGTWTACVSSQVGCPLGCTFCATGKGGFRRNLKADEIIGQLLFWISFLKNNYKDNIFEEKQNLANIVYMGMGEPFLNWPEVSESIREITKKDGLGFGSRSISISTAGIPDGIRKLADEFPQVNLAVSLHSAENKIRNSLVTLNEAFDLASIKRALEKYMEKTNRKVFLEYTLINNVNDSPLNAERLVKYIKSFDKKYLLHVNLISYNDAGCGYSPSPKEKIHSFKKVLIDNHISTTTRKSLGDDIKGACGQLSQED